MERSPGEGPSPSPMDQPSAPSDPTDQPPAAHAKPDPGSGGQPAGPGAAGEALAVLTSFGRRLLVLIPVYLAGAVGLSVGFVLFGLALYLGWRRVRDEKERSLRAARQLLDDEEQLTAKTLYMSHRELPAWVSFPDVEKAEWLNKIVAQVWPFLGQYMEKLLAETVAPAVRGSNPHLQTFTFTRVELGEKPLRIIGVKVHPGQRKEQILLDLNISYVGDVQIDVEVKKYFCKAGVKGMQLHGVLRVILEPLIGDLPFVGAVSMFFIRRPTLDINWTGMTNLLDIPGLSSLSDTMIMDSIAAFLVLPNRLLVPLVPDLQDVAQLRSPLPRGIIRIHLLAARGLSSKDKYVKGLIEGKSDPYALVRLGTQTFCSRVIDEELNPQWGETYEVMVHEVPGQEIEVEVFDKDPDKDDFLGRMKLDVGKVLQASVLDDWFPLQGGQGQVHLRLEWLSLLSDAEKLEQVLQWNWGVSSRPDPPSAAILVVYLDRAQDLPMVTSELYPPQLKKGNKEPNPMVQLSIQDVTQESKAVYSTNCPVWEEAFRFFLQDPQSQELDVQVKDDSRALTLGALTLPLARLLTAPELILDQWFQLSSSGPNSRLYMKLVMRILYLDSSEICFPTVPGCPGAWDVDSENPQRGSSVDAPPRPCHTTPDSQFGTEHVLRIHVLEAQDLIAKDRFLGGLVKGKSDPYVKLKLAGRSFRSHVVREDLNPRWNEVFEVIVTSVPGQELEVEVFDKDLDKDDFLGRCKVRLTTVLNSGFLDEWLTLEDVPSGRLHLRLERLTPRPTAAELEEVLQVNSLIQTQKSAELAAALLSIYMERAEDLPLRKGTKHLSPYATLTVGDSSHKTKTISQTSAPVWDESASFLIRKPHTESLELQVRGEGTGVLGSLSLPLSELLVADQLCLDRWFTLSSGQGQVLLRAQLGILVSQHSGVEAHSHSYSHSSSSLSEEPELSGGPPHITSSAPELRQRLTHVDSPLEAPAGPLGQVKLTLWYYSEERKLVSIVHGCRSLRQNGRDPPDPYVSLLLLPDKNRGTKRRTSQKKRTLSPEFNERFEWELPLDEAQRRKLDVSVKSNSSFMSRERELLGKVQLDLAETDLSQGVARWYDLMDNKDKGSS
ncbi:extended synaptotagmin 1 [Homo sapiens]|uniref:Isoform 2 of Extended synaptotagmin-1 n=1 Tax=Homo sapiens TaxID=9606 RepID=Q9BSJ8-2|nr:extended synaptotagmin-1 isoform 1 [Homo sapiens]EAW96890.1 family with sequence similarity 62 (C2 domain containing), member A, isoform CRA_a [Homo sapiens]EAW96893.1 family with sequence similarity 62 (C2 domain containing), member A, isoform CRA_a [Homo sapiens]KAI2566307.1 extended synaptotagmin 1 [Homo sapiens]KAI4066554.1 extended synaptotagmin 1 [Homo sapiens]|eukprot:NP_001171725.1 extended synaptotagmin-1 isoform 1 [Homo sapiens]